MKTFEEISVCPYCSALAEERSFGGNDGATFCSDGCGCIEGEGSLTKFVCPDCEQLCDEEKCTCKDLNYTFLKPDGSRFSFTDTSYESASKKVHYSDHLQTITK